MDEVTLDGVVVLAYRIRRVGKSPNPDQSLSWEPAEHPSSSPSENSHPFPLATGHAFGSKSGAGIHDGTASAQDRVSVLALQTRLRETCPGLTVDGVVGKETDKAIRAFQKQHRMDVDGLAGPATWKAAWS